MARGNAADNPFMKRVAVVMRVQAGLISAAEAAEKLGIARGHYYRMEERILGAALAAATPKKRGRKTTEPDPKAVDLEGRLKETRRERDLLQIRVLHLEEIQKDMVTRGIGVLRKKKRPATRPAGRCGKALHGPLPADGAREGRQAQSAGGGDPGAVPGNGTRLRESLPLEAQGREGGETRTQAPEGGN